jgi:asparagine N-glycosylation enzyme membrane subunit Stt3
MDKRTVFLICVVIISITIHISPFFFIDNTKFNFYDTDTWYTLRQIQLLNSNQPTAFEPMLVPPNGRSIDWSDFTARIGTLFTDSTNTLQIFNMAGFVPIALLLCLCVVGSIFLYILYGKQQAAMAFVLLSIPTGGMCYQAMYGVVDHHLLECILGVGLVLCIVIILTKSRWFVIPAIAFSFISFINSYEVFLIFIIVSTTIVFVWIIIQYLDTRKLKYLILILCVIVGGFLTYALGLIPQRVYLFFNYVEPIVELYPLSPLTFIVDFNFLLILAIVALYNKQKTQTILIGVSCLVLTIMALRFSRCEVLVYPFVAILAASCDVNKITKCLCYLFIIVALILSVVTASSIPSISTRYSDFDTALTYLHDKPSGVVLSWGDYGHWILMVSNKTPLADPFQDNSVVTAEIFTNSNKSHSLDLIKRYNISYILVSSEDVYKYHSMRYYCIGGDYEKSMLKKLIDARNTSEFHSDTISIFNTTPSGLSTL